MATKEKEENKPMTLSFPPDKIKEFKIKAIEEDLTTSELLVAAFDQYVLEKKEKK